MLQALRLQAATTQVQAIWVWSPLGLDVKSVYISLEPLQTYNIRIYFREKQINLAPVCTDLPVTLFF